MTDQVDPRKVVGWVIVWLIGGVVAWLGQPLIHGNEQAINLLITVFSILAGFLIAITTLLADPALLPGKTWRGAELARPRLLRRLKRNRLLFVCYLLTLAIIFITLLVDSRSPCLTLWLERAYILLATVGFLYSLTLPWSLARIQEERLDREIDDRREEVGFED